MEREERKKNKTCWLNDRWVLGPMYLCVLKINQGAKNKDCRSSQELIVAPKKMPPLF